MMIAACMITSASYAQKKKDKDKPKPSIEGKKYTVKTTEIKMGGKASKAVEDEVVFKSQKVKSDVVNDKTGFSAISYTIKSDTSYTDSDGDEQHIITFEAAAAGDAGDELNWTGTVTNMDIEGNVKWSKNGKTKKEFNFSGGEKKK